MVAQSGGELVARLEDALFGAFDRDIIRRYNEDMYGFDPPDFKAAERLTAFLQSITAEGCSQGQRRSEWPG
jgi:hypothetical protein